jgi:hypothetical protein
MQMVGSALPLGVALASLAPLYALLDKLGPGRCVQVLCGACSLNGSLQRLFISSNSST